MFANIKEFIGILSVILTVLSYLIYIKDILKKKTLPHIYSWFIWSLINSISLSLQIIGKAGYGSWPSVVVVFFSTIVFILCFKKGTKDINLIDKLFLILSIIFLVFWLIIKEPKISAFIISLTAIISFIPTIRKSWNNPFSETLFVYELNAFRQFLSVGCINNYKIITFLYPSTWMVSNLLFSIFLILRRKNIKRKVF